MPTTTELRLGGRNYVRAGDPVRVYGKQGLWRFVHANTDADGTPRSVELVGPDRNPRTRTIAVELVRRVERSEANLARVRRGY